MRNGPRTEGIARSESSTETNGGGNATKVELVLVKFSPNEIAGDRWYLPTWTQGLVSDVDY